MKIETQIKNLFKLLDENFKNKDFTGGDSYDYHSLELKIRDFIYKKYANISDDANKKSQTCDDIKTESEEKLEELIKALNARNGNIEWDKNWSYVKEKNSYSKQFGQFLLYKAGEYRLVEPFHFIDEGTAHHLADEGNHYVNIKIINAELLRSEGGFWYYVRGRHYLGNIAIVRFYLNLNSEFKNTLKFVKVLYDTLNSRQIPFHFKFSDTMDSRTDSAVLYFHQEHYHIVFLVFQQVYLQFHTFFDNATPFFTKRFGLPGVGFAEDPMVSGESFGLSRAKIIAQIYSNYYRINCSQSLYKFFTESIAQLGYQVEEFYRNPNTFFPYDFSVFSKIDTVREIQNIKSNKLPIYVANLICKQAIVTNYNGKVSINWMGANNENEYDFDEIFYKKIDIVAKKSILNYLITVYKYFKKDWLIEYYCKILIENINANSVEKLDFDVMFKHVIIEKSDIKENNLIDYFNDEIRQRGVSSLLKDDAFNPLNYVEISQKIISKKTASDKLKELLNRNINRYLSAFIRSAFDV